jgi:predicted alpha/beta hydrolase
MTATATAIPSLQAPAVVAVAEPTGHRLLVTPDGTEITARFFAPARPEKARGAVLVVPAMGVPQSFYAPLSEWLAAEGFHTATFDYRGMGLSRRAPLRRVDADIVTWAEQDTATALEALAQRAPRLPITWIGHSLGGQIVPFVGGHERVARVVTVAAGSGFWRDNAPALKRKVGLFWFGLVPLLTPLFGYFPGRRLGMVGDLPRNVVRQWRRWCLNPDYAAGAEGAEVRTRYAGVRVPISSFSFTDDEMMSQRSIEAIHAQYTSAPRVMRRFAPGELGLERVGHFGFFRREMQTPLWETHLRPELAER